MRTFRMILMFFACLLPSFWAAGLTWLALHKDWFESDTFAFWIIAVAILAVAQVAFAIGFLSILEKEGEPTTPKQS